jgi:hypothetical protein
MFRLRKEKPNKEFKIKIANINELKRNQFKEWGGVEIKREIRGGMN